MKQEKPRTKQLQQNQIKTNTTKTGTKRPVLTQPIQNRKQNKMQQTDQLISFIHPSFKVR